MVGSLEVNGSCEKEEEEEEEEEEREREQREEFESVLAFGAGALTCVEGCRSASSPSSAIKEGKEHIERNSLLFLLKEVNLSNFFSVFLFFVIGVFVSFPKRFRTAV